MMTFSRLVLAVALLSTCAAAPALSADNKAPAKKVTSKLNGIKTDGTVSPTGGTGGGTVVELNSSDCKLLLGGQVITVTDGRCGASGAYCKSPSGSACLTEK